MQIESISPFKSHRKTLRQAQMQIESISPRTNFVAKLCDEIVADLGGSSKYSKYWKPAFELVAKFCKVSATKLQAQRSY